MMATWFKSKIALLSQSYAERKRKKMIEESKRLINLIKENPSSAILDSEYIRSINLQNVLDEEGKTLLHFAVEYGHLPLTCAILDRYLIDVNCQDYEGQTPLMLAVRNKDKGIMAILLNVDANIHVCDNFGRSALQVVCNMSTVYSDIIALFLNRVKKDCWNDSEKIALILISVGCPLRHATYLHDPKVIRIMLKNGCPIHTVDRVTGQTALHVAFEYASAENIKLLLEHGANIDATDAKGRLPYFSCGMWGESDKDLEITGIIIGRSKLLTTSDESGILQIGNLLKNGKQGAIFIILRSDIDLCARDSHGRTLMHYLALNLTLADNQRLKEELKTKTFDPNACDTRGNSILLNASMSSNFKLMELLLERGADVNAMNDQNHVPLFVAMCPPESVRRRNYDPQKCVELLLIYGADLEFVLGKFNTMLVTFMNSELFNDRKEILIIDWWKRSLSAPIIGRLVLSEAKGTPIVIETIQEAIMLDSELKYRFDVCKKQIEDLKKTKVYESVTLYQLLIERKEKIAIYARNSDFLDSIKTYNGNFCLNSFYSNLLRKNIHRSIKIMEAKREIAEVISEVTGLTYESNPIIIDKIISYAMG